MKVNGIIRILFRKKMMKLSKVFKRVILKIKNYLNSLIILGLVKINFLREKKNYQNRSF